MLLGTETSGRKRIALIFLSMLTVAISACQDHKIESTTPNFHEVVGVNKKNSEQAKKAVSIYWGRELTITSLRVGPAGTTLINVSDGVATRSLIMLSDLQTVIDGTLYTPNMTHQQLSQNHSNVTHSRVIKELVVDNEKNKMKRRLGDAIRSEKTGTYLEKATREAITQRVAATMQAEKEHIADRISSAGVAKSGFVPAALPRGTTVINKQQLFQDILTYGSYIKDGDHPKTLYVFFDFTCPYCWKVHSELSRLVQSNNVEIRYLPIGALGPEATRRANASLIPDTNELRLKSMQLLSKKDTAESLLAHLSTTKVDYKDANSLMLKNLHLFKRLGRAGTPTLAYVTKAGAQISTAKSNLSIQAIIDSIIPKNAT